MSKKISVTGIPALDPHLPLLRHLGPQGFIFLHNWGWRGPELQYSEFPKEWQWEYEAKNYTFADPVLRSAMREAGDRRWSEVEPDYGLEVLAAAQRHSLYYGAIFSRGAIRKSVLSLARADRELDDRELDTLSQTFDGLVKDATIGNVLTKAELETLRLFRDGMSYKEIADVLAVGTSTVKLRLEKCRSKLGGRSNVHALVIALQRNLL